ncbi:hypothetical protein [Haloarcula amylovorans]|uniref:hypothetical protein n=1 Tax=Haloarcula amylovorans TaxID=2562280 RepID=UPI001075E8C6|nr:hypothetical protein [Halomicroarcula amylolytica]
MSPSNEEIRTALQLMPINILRTLIEERDIGVTSRSSDTLISHLVEDGWTEDEYEALKQRLANIQRERQPYSRYVVAIDSIDQSVDRDEPQHERIATILEANPAEFDETGLARAGFELDEININTVTGIHWTKSINYKLTPLNEIKADETVYETGFHFDLDENNLLIDCSLPAKASNLTNVLDNSGIITESVGHNDYATQRANQFVQDFVNDFKDQLVEQSDQTSLDPNNTASALEIDLVEMLVDEAELEDIRIGGRTDIIGNPTVEDLQEDHDARVVRLEGQFRLDRTYYNFIAGYTDDMGQISVKKQGRVEERPELVKDAFDYIYDTYHGYFVDV